MDGGPVSPTHDARCLLFSRNPANGVGDNESQPLYTSSTMSTQIPTSADTEPENNTDGATGTQPDHPSSVFTIPPVKSFPWERCPIEILDMIFDEVDNRGLRYFAWGGSMPFLVVALWGLHHSYKQALQRFVKASGPLLRLDPSTGYCIRDMNRVELDTFEDAKLLLDDPVDSGLIRRSDKGLNFVDYGFQRPEWFTSQFLRAENIRKVHISLNLHCSMSDTSIAHFIPEFPFWLQGFKLLSEVSVQIPVLHRRIDGSRHRRIVNAIMDRILRKVGVQGQRLTTKYSGVGTSVEIWVWKACPGQTMDWPQNLGTIWKRPPEYYNQDWWKDETPWDLLNLHWHFQLRMKEGQFVMIGGEWESWGLEDSLFMY